jgi:hypothetical protein
MRNNLCSVECGLNYRILVLLFVTLPIFSIPVESFAQEHGSVLAVGASRDEINRGRRFFMGLLPFERNHASCVSCHYLVTPDTLNWNPSALDLAYKVSGTDSASFYRAVMEPTGNVISRVHENIELTPNDVQYIKIYLDNLARTGTAYVKPSINRILLFLFLGVILTLALLDLLIFKKIKFKVIPLVIFFAAFGYQLFMLYEEAVLLGRSPGYQPDQPIKFSHQVHMAENHMDCMYCHHTVTTSKTANIPSTTLCMNCHIVVREGSRSGRFEIDKLVKAYEEGRSIEWIRIHKLPDHVYFSHAQHVGVGNLDCMLCHGNVEQMHIVRQEKDLSMGWCVECHRETKVDFIDNEYYSIFEAFHKDLAQGVRDSILAVNVGANNCSSCHY